MRVKDLFSVPEGKPITEQTFYRVLACTICSMILSMSCLVGTTWALFSVSIETPPNQISISEIRLALGDEPMQSGISLQPNTYDVKISYKFQRDSLSQMSKAYVIFSLGDQEQITQDLGYVTLDNVTDQEETVKITVPEAGSLYYTITWKVPENLQCLEQDASGTQTTDPNQTPGTGETPDPNQTPGNGETPDPNQTPGTGETPDPNQTPGNGDTPDPNQTPGTGDTTDPNQTPGNGETPDPNQTPGNGDNPDPNQTPGTDEPTE